MTMLTRKELDKLIKLAQDSNAIVRKKAALELAKHYKIDEGVCYVIESSILGVLTQLANDRSSMVRDATLIALSRIQPSEPEVLSLIANFLADDNMDISLKAHTILEPYIKSYARELAKK